MQMMSGILAVVASLAGVLFAGSGVMNSNASNGISCTANSITLAIGSSANCGSWMVTLLNTSSVETENSAANVPVALFSVYLNSGSQGRVFLKASRVVENDTGRVCFSYANGIVRDDEGFGIGHSCLLITVSGTGAGSATINLQGLASTRNQSVGENDDQQENVNSASGGSNDWGLRDS